MTEVIQGQTWYVYSERVEAYLLNKGPSGAPFVYRPLRRSGCFLVVDTDYYIGHDTFDHWVRVLHQGDFYIIDASHFFGGPILEAEAFAMFCPDELDEYDIERFDTR